ncbi:MAG: aminoglycoside phosphotransferase family protein [Candidatus Pacebacteria bacterium]|nr:aminoglycoside phosphotransferase family protein [Candidatus Paceibacterota bacterium]
MFSPLEEKVIGKLESFFDTKIVKIVMPRQGMGSFVFFAVSEGGKEYVIKTSLDIKNDVLAYELLKRNDTEISTPEIFTSFVCDNKTFLVMEKIKALILEDVPDKDKGLYIDSMLENLSRIHKIKSERAGLVDGRFFSGSWKENLLFKYSGLHPWFDWKNILERTGVDRALVEDALVNIVEQIKKVDLPCSDYSLLHTDFNQRNLFVDPQSCEIVSIVDWSEAAFGDPLYDFARVRMFIQHFDLGEIVLKKYYSLLKLNKKERVREDLYFINQVVDYIAWYSESETNFNIGRLALHQKILREYKW